MKIAVYAISKNEILHAERLRLTKAHANEHFVGSGSFRAVGVLEFKLQVR